MTNIEELAVDNGPTGLDPIIEKQADDYGRRTWSMDMEPVLTKVLGDTLTDELVAQIQEALFEHKYTVLTASKEKKAEKAKLGKRW